MYLIINKTEKITIFTYKAFHRRVYERRGVFVFSGALDGFPACCFGLLSGAMTSYIRR